MDELEITNNKLYSILDKKLRLMAEVQSKTFDLIEEYDRKNEEAHKHILKMLEG